MRKLLKNKKVLVGLSIGYFACLAFIVWSWRGRVRADVIEKVKGSAQYIYVAAAGGAFIFNACQKRKAAIACAVFSVCGAIAYTFAGAYDSGYYGALFASNAGGMIVPSILLLVFVLDKDKKYKVWMPLGIIAAVLSYACWEEALAIETLGWMFYHWSYGVEGFAWLFIGVFWLYGFLCMIDIPTAEERKEQRAVEHTKRYTDEHTKQYTVEHMKRPQTSYLEQYRKDHNL